MDRENYDRIITTQMFRELIEQNSQVDFLRSSLSTSLDHGAEIIRAACRNARSRKVIRVILPSVLNADFTRRAAHLHMQRNDVINRLIDWQEELVKLTDELAPEHSFELRTHDEPHRWHGVFSPTEGVAGIAWHATANMPYSSLDLGPGFVSCKWMLHFMSTDFSWLWLVAKPYRAGDAKRDLANARTESTGGVHPVVAKLQPRLEKVMEVLRTVKTLYPDADGNGITKAGMARHFSMDESGGNALLRKMQTTGLIQMLYAEDEDVNSKNPFGRIMTDFGLHVLNEWEISHPARRPSR